MSGVGFFVIVDGTATVTVDGKNVATLGAGAHFGELALLTESVRTATIVAETRLACLVIAS